MSEPIRVYGHPRSGNHFLAAMVHRHFYDDDPAFSLEVDPVRTGHWSRRADALPPKAGFTYGGLTQTDPGTLVPYGKLLGSHRLPPPADVSRAVYIYRDGRDVALSVYAWTRFRRHDQEELSLEQYLARPIDWVGSPGHRRASRASALATADPETLFEHWRRHVSVWLATEALAVRYEDLVRWPFKELGRISDHFGLSGTAGAERMGPVGWNATQAAPEKAELRLAKWRSRMSSRALAMYDATVPRDFKGRWEP